jgi:beta-N-acetylhexosaminidase
MEFRAARFEAGRLMMIGWEGSSAAEAMELLQEFQPFGMVFFKRNYPGSPDQLRFDLHMMTKLGRALRQGPFLTAIDNEGGTVRRLPEPFIQLPSARESALRGVEAVKNEALASGKELAYTGFNVNLAPVLDVGSPGSYMDSRSFGEEADFVIKNAQAFREGFRQAGLLCCGKHFPGLGAATVDPHDVLPTVSLSLAEMNKHLAPFKALIDQGLEMVMTTHCLYPAWDANRPATFSPKVVGVLKQTLGFKGPLLTDDLQMGAVTNNLQPGEAAVAAFEAGHDLILMCRDRKLIKGAFDALVGALASGRIKRDRLEDARERLQKLTPILADPQIFTQA